MNYTRFVRASNVAKYREFNMSDAGKSLRQSHKNALINLGLEDASALDLFPDYVGGRYGDALDEWRFAVSKFVRLALSVKLMAVKNGLGYFDDDADSANIENIYKNTSIDEDALWMGVQFVATDMFRKILTEEIIYTWMAFNYEINQSLSSALWGNYSLVSRELKRND
ncbi:hypothetical protein [Variovorax fucosicus]|uniref:hypothetical protein n=1 Tax=Variovorax fucosicus TaxID=3053517 RepID=UPI002578F885|nr:hypothetical protein [Variovorax sp. J22G47]MDM0059525.1 hypothetical protein [Variovorax sp. J22G47]